MNNPIVHSGVEGISLAELLGLLANPKGVAKKIASLVIVTDALLEAEKEANRQTALLATAREKLRTDKLQVLEDNAAALVQVKEAQDASEAARTADLKSRQGIAVVEEELALRKEAQDAVQRSLDAQATEVREQNEGFAARKTALNDELESDRRAVERSRKAAQAAQTRADDKMAEAERIKAYYTQGPK